MNINLVDQHKAFSTRYLNQQAPDFEIMTTAGIKRLDDYRGKWLVIFTHQADFSSASRERLVAFSQANQNFTLLGCELLALSRENVYSHIALAGQLRMNRGVRIDFPITTSAPDELFDDGFCGPALAQRVWIIDGAGTIRCAMSKQEPSTKVVDTVFDTLVSLQVSDAQQAVGARRKSDIAA